jgi:small-conductance mechanosensitive channel
MDPGTVGLVVGQSTVQWPTWVPGWVPGWTAPIVATLVVLVVAWAVARVAVRVAGRRLAQRFGRPSLTRTALRGIRGGIFVLALLVVLRINGLDLGDLTLSVAVFSAVVGVILAPIVGSIISGVFLLADQPYEIGDMIELTDEGKKGFVEDITLRYTKIFTLDNTFLVIPNGNIRDRDVYNYSAEDPRTRQTLDVLVTYESDVTRARELIERSAREVDAVIEGGPRIRIGGARYPAQPDCLIATFADHGIRLRLRYWVKEPYRVQKVQSKLQTNVWEALDDADVEIAYPHSHLYFDDTSGTLDVSMGKESPRGEVATLNGRQQAGDGQTPTDGNDDRESATGPGENEPR